MIPFSERAVERVYVSYPEVVRPTMLALRDLVFSVAQELGLANGLSESLKWGVPSYKSGVGSALRIHWRESDPEYGRVFFHCQTRLVETFRELYADVFEFEGNRAIKLRLGDEVDLVSLGGCVELALRYHEIKHLPMLGVGEKLMEHRLEEK